MTTPKILVVEDEIVTRNTLKGIFEAEGYDVFEAENGVEMHHILTNHNINLVVMDINLPGKNGLLLARELREELSLPLIFLTGRDNEVDKILGLEIGADDYLTKPFNPRELTMLHFCENPGKLQTREELLKKMTGRELKPQDRTVDVTIRRIRKHFEDHPNTPNIIMTIHGEGYRFCGDIE
ncbi:response regulator [Haemophilus influenzae]|uniref:response regulator n=1 Tax=Haemophilus influenzae TaxID=727 RepID=UPI000D00F786|nr:response regulator [Haemophilus influenzae]PRI89421.1 Aerobic respiration control protein ArcA [Haemophilus influenzae]PRJ88319.1 Aerobic respiration control protein ArcA [Haemophilus influenzae]